MLSQDLGQAPIHHQHFAEGADHDVRRLQIAMQNSARMGKRNCVADPKEQPKALRQGVELHDVSIQAKPFHELHGVEDPAAGQHPDIVYRNDAGMFELCEDARFAHEPAGELPICIRRVENLERDAPGKFFVLRGVDHAHTAARDELVQLVARAEEIRSFGATKAFDSFVAQECHCVETPKSAFTSRANSSSLPQKARNCANAMTRNSRRAQASWLFTSVRGSENLAASSPYEISSSPAKS